MIAFLRPQTSAKLIKVGQTANLFCNIRHVSWGWDLLHRSEKYFLDKNIREKIWSVNNFVYLCNPKTEMVS